MDGLVLVEGGMVSALDALRVAWLPSMRVGLFQNDWRPKRWDTLAAVVPATFSGYSGLHAAGVWFPATLDGDVAISTSEQKEWAHDGGASQNWIFGYYVVDALGQLRWAERTSETGESMHSSSSRFRVTPRFAQGSRYPGSEA